jgi:hypothetical protein
MESLRSMISKKANRKRKLVLRPVSISYLADGNANALAFEQSEA